jgi:hypothetical protein
MTSQLRRFSYLQAGWAIKLTTDALNFSRRTASRAVLF